MNNKNLTKPNIFPKKLLSSASSLNKPQNKSFSMGIYNSYGKREVPHYNKLIHNLSDDRLSIYKPVSSSLRKKLVQKQSHKITQQRVSDLISAPIPQNIKDEDFYWKHYYYLHSLDSANNIFQSDVTNMKIWTLLDIIQLKQKIQTNNKSTHLYTEKNDGVISILEKIQELYERKKQKVPLQSTIEMELKLGLYATEIVYNTTNLTDSDYNNTDTLIKNPLLNLINTIYSCYFTDPYSDFQLLVCKSPILLRSLELLRNEILKKFTLYHFSLIDKERKKKHIHHFSSLFSYSLPLLKPQESHFNPTNPSMVQWKNDWWCMIRKVNYSFSQGNGTYIPAQFKGLSETKNILVQYRLDGNKLNPLKQWSLNENIPSNIIQSLHCKGIEDIRLFVYKNELFFNAVCCQLNSKSIPEMIIGKLSAPDSSIKTITIEKWGKCVINSESLQPEKNWLYISPESLQIATKNNNTITFLYKINQGMLLLAKVDISSLINLQQTPLTSLYSLPTIIIPFTKISNPFEWRGSSAPQLIPETKQSVLSVHYHNKSRFYWQVLLIMDQQGNICEWSDPFTMTQITEKETQEGNYKVDFLMSMSFIDSDQILFTWGNNDKYAKYHILSWKHIRNTLKFYKNIIELNNENLKQIQDQTNPLFDIVIPVGYKDKERYKECVRNIQTHLKGKYNIIFVVSPLSSKELDIEIDMENKIYNGQIRYINEYDPIYPFKDIQTFMKKIFPHFDSSRLGWYKQQLIKLYSPLVIPDITDRVLWCDSDVLFQKSVDFFSKNREESQYDQIMLTIANENHMPYFQHIQKLIPELTKQNNFSGVAHHMMVYKPILQDLFQRIECYHKMPFWQAFLSVILSEHVNLSGASEYEIYYNYVLKHYPDIYKIVEREWVNTVPLQEYLKISKTNSNTNSKIDYYACHSHL